MAIASPRADFNPAAWLMSEARRSCSALTPSGLVGKPGTTEVSMMTARETGGLAPSFPSPMLACTTTCSAP